MRAAVAASLALLVTLGAGAEPTVVAERVDSERETFRVVRVAERPEPPLVGRLPAGRQRPGQRAVRGLCCAWIHAPARCAP